MRMYRQRYALSERELAFLIDQHWQTTISRLEGGRHPVSLQVALALQVLFRVEPRKLFPDLYDGVEDVVMRRAKALVDKLEGKTDARSAHKRNFLESLASEGGPDLV